jgi:hypothetical protein
LSSWIVVLTAWWAAFAALAGAPQDASLVDEVVAVVNRQVVTRSEVWEEAILILAERGGQAGLQRQITPGFLKQVLDMLINQQILLDEARRVGLPPVSEGQREQLIEGFRRRFADREAYTRFLLEQGISEAVVGEALVRHYRIERLKENKLRVMPEVSEKQVQLYYEEHRMDFGGATLPEVAQAIRLRLSREQQERELARWISELGKRSDVKVLVDLGQGRDQDHDG